MNTPNGYRIERIDLATAPEDTVREGALIVQTMNHERVPEDPLTPVEAIMQRIRATTPSNWRANFVARDASGKIVGTASVGYNTNEPENAHARWTEVNVLPQHRRKGLATALYTAAVEACLDQREDLVFFGQTNDRVPASEAFAKSIGASPGLPMKLNQLTIAEVDRKKVAEWKTLDPKGYRLVSADNVIPKEITQAYLDAVNAMNDMPKGDLRFEDHKFTEEQLRERESWLKQSGSKWWVIVAIDEATGEGAGFTEIQFDPRQGHVLFQGGTGVVAKHRGHKLGLWLKAVNLDRVIRELPEAKYIRTGNANVNEWMLAINTQLGFKHAWSTILWQLPVADARRSLGLREVAKA